MEVRWTSTPPNGCAADRRTPGTKEFSRAPGCLFFWQLFFGQAKKSYLPWVSHPQVAVEIARQARDNIQSLDARLRGHGNKHRLCRNDGKD